MRTAVVYMGLVLAACAVIAGAAMLVRGCPAQGQAEAPETETATERQEKDRSEEVPAGNETRKGSERAGAGEQTGETTEARYVPPIEGLDACSISEESKRAVEAAVASYFSQTGQTRFAIADTGEASAGYAKLVLSADGQAYDVFVGDRVMVYPQSLPELEAEGGRQQ